MLLIKAAAGGWSIRINSYKNIYIRFGPDNDQKENFLFSDEFFLSPAPDIKKTAKGIDSSHPADHYGCFRIRCGSKSASRLCLQKTSKLILISFINLEIKSVDCQPFYSWFSAIYAPKYSIFNRPTQCSPREQLLCFGLFPCQ